ncbi:MAG: hypothetical protein AAB386_01875 [Patescibacteria group bacterium]
MMIERSNVGWSAAQALRADSLGDSASDGRKKFMGKYAGEKCLGLKDNGKMCGTVIATHNPINEMQICQACYRRFTLRGQKPVLFRKSKDTSPTQQA